MYLILHYPTCWLDGSLKCLFLIYFEVILKTLILEIYCITTVCFHLHNDQINNGSWKYSDVLLWSSIII